MNAAKQVFHSNHYLLEHPSGVGKDTAWLADSSFRVARIERLVETMVGTAPTMETIFDLFKDEANFPGAICRAQKAPSQAASLFNIVMDLQARRANVTLGRPVDPEDFVQLVF